MPDMKEPNESVVFYIQHSRLFSFDILHAVCAAISKHNFTLVNGDRSL